MAIKKSQIRNVNFSDIRLPDKLQVRASKPGSRFRWVKRDRVEQLEAIGYEHLDSLGEKGQPKTFVKKKDGEVKVGDMVLMHIPEETFQDRQALKQAFNDKKEQSVGEGVQQLVDDANASGQLRKPLGVTGDGVKSDS